MLGSKSPVSLKEQELSDPDQLVAHWLLLCKDHVLEKIPLKLRWAETGTPKKIRS